MGPRGVRMPPPMSKQLHDLMTGDGMIGEVGHPDG